MRRRRVRTGDWAWNVFNYTALTLIGLVTLFPFYWVLIASISAPFEVLKGNVLLWPQGLALTAYEIIFDYTPLWRSLGMTVFYTVAGTTLNILLTMMMAYPLSRTWLRGRDVLSWLVVFTMFFGGGLIPSFLLVRALGMLDTIWVMILPGAVSAFNLVMARTYLTANMPDELVESAQIDGASDLRIFWSIVMPLSGPIIAVLVLFYAVAHWNDLLSGLLYLQNRDLFSIQLVLRNIVYESWLVGLATGTAKFSEFRFNVKYAVVVIGLVPILSVYPFVQRYFVQGVMLGSLKG